MYALMTRALKNVGDDLIHARARRLFEHIAPEQPLVVAKAWQPLAASLSPAQIRVLRGIVVPGGPGARRELDTVYPFLSEAVALRIPVYFLGVGSRYFPGTFGAPAAAMDEASSTRLRSLAEHAPIGVRDYLTLALLREHGVRAQLNGCPAWYSLEHIDRRPELPKALSRIAFTPPGDLRFVSQSLGVMRHLRELLPTARVLVGFHHGIEVQDTTMNAANARIVAQARTLGFECVDLSERHEKLAIYDECDLHVGYRVHAHIYFSSVRKPTFLLAEDSRGTGVLHALGGVGRAAWNGLAESSWSRRALVAAAGADAIAAADDEIGAWLEVTLEREQDLGYPQVAASAAAIDRAFRERMRPFVQSIVVREPG